MRRGGPVVKQFFILCSSSDPSHSYNTAPLKPLNTSAPGIGEKILVLLKGG